MTETTENGDNHVNDDAIVTLMAERQRIQDKQDAVNNERKAFKRKLKGAGVPIEHFEAAFKMRDMDEGVIRDKLDGPRRFLQALRINVQPDLPGMGGGSTNPMDPNEDRAEEIIAAAKNAGFRAGALGEGIDKNPHSPTAPAGQKWIEGWHEGAERNRRDANQLLTDLQLPVKPEHEDVPDEEDDEDEDDEQEDDDSDRLDEEPADASPPKASSTSSRSKKKS